MKIRADKTMPTTLIVNYRSDYGTEGGRQEGEGEDSHLFQPWPVLGFHNVLVVANNICAISW